jgi:hypothetical protein
MQIGVAEFGDDEIQDVRLAHFFDFTGELEKLEDAADIGGKAVDVAGEVLVNVVRVALELLERELGVIVKPLAGGFVQELVEGVVLVLSRWRSNSRRTFSFDGASTASNRRNTVIGSMTRSYCGGRYGPRSKSAICQMKLESS